MHILLLQADLHIPASQSLKDKRSVLRSVIDRLRTTYNVSVAEVENHDKWQLATIAVVTVSRMRQRAEDNIRKVVEEIESRGDVIVTAIDQQWL